MTNKWSKRTLKDSSFFRLIVENVYTPIVLVDRNSRIEYVNTSAQSLFGVSVSRIEGLELKEIFVDANILLEALTRSQSEGLSVTERETDLTLIPNLKKIKVDCTFSPFVDQSSSRYVLMELRDVEQSTRFTREESRIAQQNALKLLLRGMAHEIKNPLGGLRGAAQLLDRALPSDDLKEYTRIIIGEADRLQRLVDDVLGPNKILRKTTCNVHEILEHVRQLVLAEATGELVIDRDYDPSIPEVVIDRDRMIQAILNILKNAQQAVDGRGRVVIRSRTIRRFSIGHHLYRLVLKIDIIDNGPGIPDHLIEQIFLPMVTTRANGTGLGLSIAQTIVSQHEGTVECTSVPGETVFSIYLPIERQNVTN